MLYIFLTMTMIAFCFLSYLFLSTSNLFDDGGIPLKAVGRAATALDSMSAIVPESQNRKMREIESTVSLSSMIVSSVKSDEIACVVPKETDYETKNSVTLPGQAAYVDTSLGEMFGDAVISNASTLQLENPLLLRLKANEEKYNKLVSEMLLFMDTSNDKFSKRMRRISEEISEILMSLRSELITACSEQRTRLRLTHPQLSHYHFKHESIHDKSDLPSYMFGVYAKPVLKTNANTPDHDALMSEFYSY